MQGLKKLNRRGNTRRIDIDKIGENVVCAMVGVSFIVVLSVVMMMIADGLGFDVSTLF